MDCAFDLDDLFDADHTVEPEYDYFISCFDQGLSEAEIKERYNFVNLNKFNEGGSVSFIGKGNINCAQKTRSIYSCSRNIPLICREQN